VACNADNSIAVIDVYLKAVVQQVPAGYLPYGIAVSYDGRGIYATNWGLTPYQFANPVIDATTSNLLSLSPAPANQPASFTVPGPSIAVSLFQSPSGNGYYLRPAGAIANSAVDDLYQVGGPHPSAAVTVRYPATGIEMLFYTKSNSDSLGVVRLDRSKVLEDFDLSLISLTLADGHKVHGAYPSALVAAPDGSKLYVAESGINSVAVLDISRPLAPVLLGRIPTGWYPTSLAITPDGQFLFVTNAKGAGEDLNLPAARGGSTRPGVASDAATDSNSIFGTVQVVSVGGVTFDNTTVLANNYSMNPPVDTSVIPSDQTRLRDRA
jgi:DNA-binding beta-propeller fold protein YncE